MKKIFAALVVASMSVSAFATTHWFDNGHPDKHEKMEKHEKHEQQVHRAEEHRAEEHRVEEHRAEERHVDDHGHEVVAAHGPFTH